MNEFAGFTKAVPGGFWAMLRFARDSHPKPVLTEGEKPHVFATELDALRAVNKHLLQYFNGVGNHEFRRDGDRLTDYRDEAESLFSKHGSASPKPPKQRTAKCSRTY